MTTARQVAADVLHRSRSRDAFAAELIDDALATANLTALDRRFLTQLVFGVIRRRGTLDALLKPFIQIPLHAVQPRVWDVLHLGTFQLVFLTHIPKHAAVNETVELATPIGSPKARGFINGVMRRIAELVTDEFTDKPSADAVPFDNRRYRKLARVPSFPTLSRSPTPISPLASRCPSGSRTVGSIATARKRRLGSASGSMRRRPSGSASTSSTPTARPTAFASPRHSSTPIRANIPSRYD